MDPAEAEATADKQAGYGMVRWAAVPGGKEDWYGPAQAENIHSLGEITRLAGR